jgi:hypothetical protein
VPTVPSAGVVRIGAFISDRTIEVVPEILGQPNVPVRIFGNDRDFDYNFDANRTKYTLELNFKTGQGYAWATPSCWEVSLPVVGRIDCHEALPVDNSQTGSRLRTQFLFHSDRPGVRGMRLLYREKISLVEGIPLARLVPAAIDGDFNVLLGDNGDVCIEGTADRFPSLEAYQYRTNEPLRTLFTENQSVYGPGLLNPEFPTRSIDTC